MMHKEKGKTIFQQFAQKSALSLLFQFTATGFGFVSVTLLAKWLGAGEYGRYIYIVTWVFVLAKLISALFDRLLVRQTAYYDTRNLPSFVFGLLRVSLSFTLIASLIVSVLLGMARYFLFYSTDSFSTIILWIIVLCGLPFTALLSNINSFVQGKQRVLASQMSELGIMPVLWLLCILLLYLISINLSVPLKAEWVALGNLIVLCIVFVISMLVAWPSIKPLFTFQPLYDVKLWRKSAGWFFGANALFLLNNRADLLLLGYLSNNETVGIYKISVTLSEVLKLPLVAVNAVLLPQISVYFAQKNMVGLQKLVKYSARLSTSVALLIGLFLLIVSPYLLLFFGNSYSSSYNAMLVLCAGQLVNVASGSVGNILNMTHHDRDVFVGLIISTVLNIGLNILLIPIYGYMGAAYSSAISTALWNIILLSFVYWRLKINPSVF